MKNLVTNIGNIEIDSYVVTPGKTQYTIRNNTNNSSFYNSSPFNLNADSPIRSKNKSKGNNKGK